MGKVEGDSFTVALSLFFADSAHFYHVSSLKVHSIRDECTHTKELKN